jgi:hypothetical protein
MMIGPTTHGSVIGTKQEYIDCRLLAPFKWYYADMEVGKYPFIT